MVVGARRRGRIPRRFRVGGRVPFREGRARRGRSPRARVGGGWKAASHLSEVRELAKSVLGSSFPVRSAAKTRQSLEFHRPPAAAGRLVARSGPHASRSAATCAAKRPSAGKNIDISRPRSSSHSSRYRNCVARQPLSRSLRLLLSLAEATPTATASRAPATARPQRVARVGDGLDSLLTCLTARLARR